MKNVKSTWVFSALLFGAIGLPSAFAESVSDMERLGKVIFKNEDLSKNKGQACASCHDKKTGFSSPLGDINNEGAVVHGAKKKRAGNRKPPTTAYTTFSAPFVVNGSRASGGTFWDGRATGEAVGADIFPESWDAALVDVFDDYFGPAVDQAMGPLLNDVEQNLNDRKQLCRRLKKSINLNLWSRAWGEPLRCQDDTLEQTHKRIAFAIAVFEGSSAVNAFSSKWDRAIEEELAEFGEVTLPLGAFNDKQNLGHSLFEGNCASFCHNGVVDKDGVERQLFTRPNAGYFNIGVPPNPLNPFYTMDKVKDDNGEIINPLGAAWVDFGLAGRDEDGIPGSDFVGQEGKFKTPTLRNVNKRPDRSFVKAYSHNGYFKSLESMVHFYNTRDLKPSCESLAGVDNTNGRDATGVYNDTEAMMADCWPEPEVLDNVFACSNDSDCKVTLAEGETFETYCDNPENPRNVGNFCFTAKEERALVAFLKTLSD